MPETIPITIEVMQPRRPRKGSHWLLGWHGEMTPPLAVRAHGAKLPHAELWTRGRLRVMSSLDIAELPDKSGIGPQWHVSVSRYPDRASKAEVQRALRDFDMIGAEQDNHEPGCAKHFWLPVDAAHRVECECKQDEAQVVEQDGHVWSNALEPGECRGCVLERAAGRPCPLHTDGSVAL